MSDMLRAYLEAAVATHAHRCPGWADHQPHSWTCVNRACRRLLTVPCGEVKR